ncbi:nuclear transport factor 2 family protein [Negadavirga shengliensis]|uniref:Nuclear transport factor 2 family protein n=1 Tax=Negadavirga shengliensis TaxID=1389218 RepID=A0ABV9SZ11_9BACT
MMGFIIFSLLFLFPPLVPGTGDPEKPVQAQLDAYNRRDIDAFIEPYAEDVKVFNFPDELLYEGKTNMRDVYARFFGNTPELHCHLENRMVLGNTVIDHEKVTLAKDQPPLRAIAIYKIRDGKIAEVYFIRDKSK